MTKISIIMAGLFLVAACNNSKDEKTEKKVKYSDLVTDNLKGDVQSIEETPYKVDSTGKMGEMDTCCIEKWGYDENGNFSGSVSKNNKGDVAGESQPTRHENGLWKGTKDTKYGKVVFSMNTTLNDKGEYLLAEAFDSIGKLEYYYTNLTQNEYGQVMHWKQYDKDSVYRMEGENKYEKNLWMGFTGTDSVGKVKSNSMAKYNDKGEQTEVSNTTINKDSTTTKVTKYTYDAHDDMGNWTQRTEWDDKGKAVKIIKRAYTYGKKESK